VVVGDKEEASRAAGGVDDGVGDGGTDDFDDGLDQRPRGEVLAGA